jgi:5-methylcytosine-specific restriction endonuclease McrA
MAHDSVIINKKFRKVLGTGGSTKKIVRIGGNSTPTTKPRKKADKQRKKTRLGNTLESLHARLKELNIPFSSDSSLAELWGLLHSALLHSERERKGKIPGNIEIIKKAQQPTPTSERNGENQTPSIEPKDEESVYQSDEIAEKRYQPSLSHEKVIENGVSAEIDRPPIGLDPNLEKAGIPEIASKNQHRVLTEEELRVRSATSNGAEKRDVTTTSFNRNIYVSELAKNRAKGICQLCDNPSPFKDRQENPYLESHHIEWLSKGGVDTMENTVALCPNCHRKLHVLGEEADIEKLRSVARKKLPVS